METLVSIVGGVGLFLLGMAVMTDGLKALAGTALKTVMEKAAATPLLGTFWGAVITLIVQSSSATTMTTIGLVSAGLLTFPQGLARPRRSSTIATTSRTRPAQSRSEAIEAVKECHAGGNRYLPMGIGAVIVLQLLYTYAPPLQSVFETEALPLGVWPWHILGGLIFFLVVEAEKAIIRAMRSRQPAVEAAAPA